MRFSCAWKAGVPAVVFLTATVFAADATYIIANEASLAMMVTEDGKLLCSTPPQQVCSFTLTAGTHLITVRLVDGRQWKQSPRPITAPSETLNVVLHEQDFQ